jgi:hypothetical protein
MVLIIGYPPNRALEQVRFHTTTDSIQYEEDKSDKYNSNTFPKHVKQE